jgi:hypothetical protein
MARIVGCIGGTDLDVQRVMRLAIIALLAGACSASPPTENLDPPRPPGKDDHFGFSVSGAKGWYLVGNGLTAGDDRLGLAITGPAETDAVHVWLDLRYAGRARATSGGWSFDLQLDAVDVGEHQLLLAADDAEFAFSEVRFRRSHPLYVAVSNDWDDPDNDDAMLERQERLHARHPDLRLTHFVGPYTFTDPTVSAARRQFLVDWVTRLRDTEGDEIGLHVHPYCNFIQTAGVTCRTSPSFARASDATGYTVILSSYTEAELEKIFARATELFEANGLPAPTSFRAGGWTAETHVLKALASAGHVADSSACNWSRLEEWKNHPGASLFAWNQQHWAPIDELTQPYYPSTADILADAGPHLPILEVPDNGLLVDYVSGAEMIDMFRNNWTDGAPLDEPRVYSIGYHPPNFSETFFGRIDQALTEIDRHLASAGTGPVVYARVSELTKAFPRP